MHTAAPLGLLFALATLFRDSSACTVTPSCLCDEVPFKMRCELYLSGILFGNDTLVHTGLRLNCSGTSTICSDAFKTLPCRDCLHDIYLERNNVSVIEPDAFRGLQQLDVACVNNNEIGELHHSTFQHNPRLKRLDISFNRLRFLHPDTFVHMKSFYFLNVSFNNLVLNDNLLNSEYINILDAGHCNRMRDSSWNVLNNRVFSGLPNLTKLVLEGNGIQSLSSDTFSRNPRLVTLNLKNNGLKVLPHAVLSHSHSIKHLHLSDNPLVCDCDMKRFSAWCLNHGVRLDEVSCDTPRASWKLLETLVCGTVPLSFTFMPITNSSISATSPSVGEPTTSPNSNNLTASVAATTPESNILTSTVSGSTAASSVFFEDKEETISKNGSNIGSLAQSTVHSTMQIRYKYTPSSNLALPKVEHTRSFFNWYVFGAICSLVASVVLVVITIRLFRRANLRGSVCTTHYFAFTFCSRCTTTNDEVNEKCSPLPCNSMVNLNKVLRHKTELQYSSRDVTSVTDVRYQVSPQQHREVATCRYSGLLETNIDTFSTTVLNEGHVYEVID